VPLVVYSAQGYDHAMTAAFAKATGIQVKLDDNSTGPLLTQIEASKNNPNWGLLWVDGATAFAGLAARRPGRPGRAAPRHGGLPCLRRAGGGGLAGKLACPAHGDRPGGAGTRLRP